MDSTYVILSKRDGEMCNLAGMRVISRAIQKERHSLPALEKIIQETRGASIFKIRHTVRISSLLDED